MADEVVWLGPKPPLVQQKLDFEPEQAAANLKANSGCRIVFSAEQREWLYKHAKTIKKGTAVVAEFQRIFGERVSPATVSSFKKMEHLEEPRKRGREELLQPREEERLLDAFRRIRAAGVAVRARTTACVARGIVERSRKGSTELTGGPLKFSTSWANSWMHSHGIRVVAATTDRNIPAAEIVKGGKQFFEQLSKHEGLSPENVYNMDEFFVLLDEGGNRSWTWERVPAGERKNVVVKDSKLGFTCSVLTSANGDVVLTQLIYKGKTERVHVGINHDDVLECHREDSHFQNAATWKEWLEAFAGVLKKRGNHESLLIIDAATQHSFCDTADQLRTLNCSVVQVPPCQTHVFQPADQYVI
jgi:hypothetical protein